MFTGVPDAVATDAAYQYCRDVSRRHAKTFYFATSFLPAEKRKAVHAVYALCRYVDDLIDQNEDKFSRKKLSRDKIIALVEQWKADLGTCYAGGSVSNPIMTAWLDTLTKYKIPMRLPLELIEGVCMDLKFVRYPSFEMLYTYCYKVASVVGLMTSEIFGYETETALPHAVDLGIAMQLTNILRDVGEDARKGRIYLPEEDFKTFGYTDDELKLGIINENFIRLMKFQIARARHYYAEADRGIAMLSPDSRLAVKISRVNYSKILDRIERNGYDVFTRRAYVPLPKKIISLPFVWLQLRLF
ncbi:MAG: phytoene/squalene synthase family protein [Rhizobacter sp.]|nr:phytoene/squalene synthase family protein [Chlorobiales bacterium]